MAATVPAKLQISCVLNPMLSDNHRQELIDSGLTDEFIERCGFYTETRPGQLSAILQKRYAKSRGGALVFPFRDTEGNVNGYKRVKPEFPRKDRNGRAIKYESPKGADNRVFFPPGVTDLLEDTTSEFLITEGEKKACKATQEGFPCLGLVGVYGWKHGKGVDRLIPDLEAVKWQGRQVLIVYDSDLGDKPEIMEAESRLAQQLINRGAKVRVARLPDLPDGSRCGLDDFLVHHDHVALRKILDKAEEPAAVKDVDDKLPAVALDPMPEARRFLKQVKHKGSNAPTLRYYRDSFFGYDQTRFRELTDSEIRSRLVKYLDPFARQISKSAVSNILACLQAETLVDSWREPPVWLGSGKSLTYIAMANGLLDVEALLAGKSEVLRPHTPAWFSVVALPFDFDPNSKCPKWMEFLNRNLEGDTDRIHFLQEWFGYCLVHDTSQQKFVVFEGEGANGKSVACATLAAMLGIDNVSHVPLEAFGQRFQLTSTLGKLANICAEVGELDKAAEGFLKSFTSGDRMTFDRKHRDPIQSMPTARLVLATNNRPRFSDRSGGLWRRMVLIPWRVTIPESERVTGMDKPEWWQASGELPGIFGWAIVGLHRLRQQGRFTQPEICKEALAEYRAESNPARLFLTENYRENSLDYTEATSIYSAYREWCQANGYFPLADRSFGKEVVRVFPNTKRGQKGTGKDRFWAYNGISNQD